MEEKECQYSILGIEKTSTEGQIKKAYQKMAREYHPDKNVNFESDVIQQREEKFKLIAEAYEVLSKEDTRATYDKFGHDGFKNQEFSDPYDIMENFTIGGEVFEKYIGKMSFGDDANQMNQNQDYNTIANQQKSAIRQLSEHFKNLLIGIANNRQQSATNIINDAVVINEMPANREVLKQFGQQFKNQAGRQAGNRSVMESLASISYSIENDQTNNNRFLNMFGSSLYLLASVKDELSEMGSLEKQNLDNQELDKKKKEIQTKLMDKYKKNEERVIQLARNAQIIMIQSKIEQALEIMFDLEKDDDQTSKQIDSLFLLGQIFSNKQDSEMFKDLKQSFLQRESDKQLLKQNKIYYQIPNNKDPKKENVKFKVEKIDIKSTFYNLQLQFNSDKFVVWMVLKKTKLEFQTYDTEELKKKILIKDLNYIQPDELNNKLIIIYDQEIEEREIKFESQEDLNNALTQLKNNKISMKYKDIKENKDNKSDTLNENNNMTIQNV